MTKQERSPTIEQVRRVVYRHDWVDLGEWVDSLDVLADLDDREIERIISPQGKGW